MIDVADDVEEMSLLVDMSYVDWMIRLICCISRELHLITYGGYLYIVIEDLRHVRFYHKRKTCISN
jgi:hypothetical protein